MLFIFTTVSGSAERVMFVSLWIARSGHVRMPCGLTMCCFEADRERLEFRKLTSKLTQPAPPGDTFACRAMSALQRHVRDRHKFRERDPSSGCTLNTKYDGNRSSKRYLPPPFVPRWLVTLAGVFVCWFYLGYSQGR